MRSGFHVSSGLGPKISHNIYQSYILPRLLYSLEVLDLNKSEIKMLSDFHVNLLQKIQSLPNRTALAAVYLLLGALPLEAVLHKRHLSLLFSVINLDNQTLHQLVRRSIVCCEDQPSSFLSRAKTILEKHVLPTIKQLMQKRPTTLQWKRQMKSALADFWTRKLIKWE